MTPEQDSEQPIGRASGPSPASGEEPSVGELALDVSERVLILAREEIELAKAEVTEKVKKLVAGSVVGIAAGVFVLLGLAMLMHAVAWLLVELLFEDEIWLGFLVEAAFWFVVAGLAGAGAARAVRSGSPPTPEMAIEEARLTRETLSGKEGESS